MDAYFMDASYEFILMLLCKNPQDVKLNSTVKTFLKKKISGGVRLFGTLEYVRTCGFESYVACLKYFAEMFQSFSWRSQRI